MNTTLISLFDRALLSNAGDYVSTWTSAAAAVAGNQVAITGTMLKITGTGGKVTFVLEGSYDGRAWLTTGLDTLVISSSPTNGFDSSFNTGQPGLDYAFLRVRAVYSTTSGTGTAIFSAGIVFSDQ